MCAHDYATPVGLVYLLRAEVGVPGTNEQASETKKRWWELRRQGGEAVAETHVDE